MKKLIIKSKIFQALMNTIGKSDNTETLDVLNKAVGHKYIKRWPKKSGKGWDYLYPKDFSSPIKALLNLFSLKKEKIEEDYTKSNIQKDYGADKKTFAAHVLEYFSNKLKWDTFFANKDNRDKYKNPQKSTEKPAKKTGVAAGKRNGNTTGKSERKDVGNSKKKDNVDFTPLGLHG